MNRKTTRIFPESAWRRCPECERHMVLIERRQADLPRFAAHCRPGTDEMCSHSGAVSLSAPFPPAESANNGDPEPVLAGDGLVTLFFLLVCVFGVFSALAAWLAG